MKIARTLAALALLAAAAAARADAASDAAQSYRIETAGTTTSVAVGKPGKIVLSIVPVTKVHVDPRAPLKITLEASPGVALARTSLGKGDAVDPKSEGRRFEIPFTAEKAGKHEAKADLDFFICSDQWCVKQVRDVTVPVDVK